MTGKFKYGTMPLGLRETASLKGQELDINTYIDIKIDSLIKMIRENKEEMVYRNEIEKMVREVVCENDGRKCHLRI